MLAFLKPLMTSISLPWTVKLAWAISLSVTSLASPFYPEKAKPVSTEKKTIIMMIRIMRYYLRS